MKKILTLLPFLFLLYGASLIAQPTFKFETMTVTRGDQFCVKVMTEDFTNLETIDKTFEWDPAVLRFTGMNTDYQAGVKGFPASINNNFDTSETGDGRLNWSWEDPSGASFTIPQSIEDTYILFEVCFESIGSFGASTEISTATDPIPRVTRLGTGGINIGCYTENGLIGTDVLPVKFILSSPEPNKGDFFDVEVEVENFFEIGSMQFTVEYDPAVLEPNGIGVSNGPNGGIPGFRPLGNTAIVRPGFITLSFFNQSGPQTLPDGTIAFTLNFRAIGDCEDYSFVRINSAETPLKITSGLDPDPNAGTNIAAVVEDGLVRIKPCDQTGGVTLSELVCPEGMPGETICVDILADGFDELTKADFLIKFNPSVLKYQSHTFPSQFQPNLVTNGASLGTLSVKWESPTPTQSVSVNNGSTVIRLCFEIVGDGTVNSPISFTGSPQPVFTKRGSNRDIGMIAQNGCVTVQAPPGLTLSAGDHEGFKGDQVCVDVTVANFSEITEAAFSINYAGNVLQYDGVQGFGALPGLSASNFTDLGNGAIGFQWQADPGALFGETVGNGETIFTLCFTIIGDATQPPLLPNCSIIEFSNDPIDINVLNASGSFNIGINSNPGNVCVKDPGAFTVTANDVTGSIDDRVCVDVGVVNCNQITSFQFSTNWNSSFSGLFDPIVEYDDVEVTGAIPGLSSANFDFSNTDVGILTVSWSGAAVDVTDNTPIFQVCFNIIGPPLQCTDFSFDENPLPVYATSSISGTNDIGVSTEDGSICTDDYLLIREGVVFNVGCPGAEDGSIFLNVGGGTPPYNYQWDNGITGNTNDVNDLVPGTYSVTLTDSGTPMATVIDTFEVTVSGTAPMADAGESVSMNCNDLPVSLDGTASSGGSNISYLWTTPDGGLVSPSDETATPNVTAPGMYVLEVMNTMTNCVSYDTVIVTPAVSDAGADAGLDQITTCYDSTALLNGSNSIGENLSYAWASLNAGLLDPATDSLSVAVALTPGMFELTVVNIRTGCEGKDTVMVIADDLPPTADAGPDMSIPCRADTITIGGTNTSAANAVYEWIEVTGGNIISGQAETAAQVNSSGIYELIVTDTLNGCQNSDLVEVIGDPNRPVADAGADTTLTCLRTDVTLGGITTSQGGQFQYFWEAFAGGIIPAGTEDEREITVSEAGNYQLRVVNVATGCESISNVSVSSFKTLPRVTAGSDFEFQCDVIQIQLDGLGSDVSTLDSTLFEYTWTNDNGADITDPNALVTTALGTGQFILEVLNTENGCVAYDTMMVTQDSVSSKPVVMIAAPTQKITCTNDQVTLNAIGSDNGADFTLRWGPAPDVCSGNGTLTPTVCAAGEYILTVINDSTSCFTSQRIMVEVDTILPIAMVGQDSFELPCDPAEVELSGQGSSVGANFRFEWTHPVPGAIDNPNTVSPIVTEPGRYTLTIVNTETGCTKDTFTTVVPAPSGIIADAGDALTLDCNNDDFEITGGTSSTDPGLTYNWINLMTGDTVATSLNWTVQDSGTYQLSVRDDKGCQAIDEVRVDENRDPPSITMISDPQTFNCFFDNATLTGTVDAQGANLNILWTSPDGNPITDETSLNPTVSQAGMYILTVENTDNGCSESASTEIIVNSANLEAATADFDAGMCDDFAMLTANLPTDANGIWTTTSAGLLDDPADPMTMVNDLPVGSNQFIWTLSTNDCPDYSSDTIFVVISGTAGSLVLRNDVIQMDSETDSVTVDFTQNDDISQDGNWTITLLDTVPTGTLTQLTDGSFIYEKADGFEGTFELFYEVCNLDCPDACDTASVRIRVAKEIIEPGDTPNAITPNGDGLNETLVFDLIEFSADDYPDRELTVFNRWGDIVYKSTPYNNDWAGTGRNGKPLPQGTYYYILRLNVAEGTIIRGDVTILK